jgi:hypothetical protein
MKLKLNKILADFKETKDGDEDLYENEDYRLNKKTYESLDY